MPKTRTLPETDVISGIRAIATIRGYGDDLCRERCQNGELPGVWREGGRWYALRSVLIADMHRRAETNATRCKTDASQEHVPA